MKFSGLLIFLAFGVIAGYGQKYPCLPTDVKEDALISPASVTSAVSVTVRDTLRSIKARCRGGKLIDRSGRKIRFYQLQGCWGNPPADYAEILEAQGKEIAVLRKKYRVIELSCNQDGRKSREIS